MLIGLDLVMADQLGMNPILIAEVGLVLKNSQKQNLRPVHIWIWSMSLLSCIALQKNNQIITRNNERK